MYANVEINLEPDILPHSALSWIFSLQDGASERLDYVKNPNTHQPPPNLKFEPNMVQGPHPGVNTRYPQFECAVSPLLAVFLAPPNFGVFLRTRWI